MSCRLIICVLIPALLTGCGSSKWAIEDPVYAEKYDRPYEDGEKLPRMAKQIVDARHLAGRTGHFIGGAYRNTPRSQSGSFGVFGYGDEGVASTYLAGHMSHTDFDGETLLGLETGARIQTPSRLAPFAGAGATGGVSADEVGKTVGVVLGAIGLVILEAINDDDDDDNFGSNSNHSHTHDDDDDDNDDGIDFHYSPFAAVYPELGVHYWLNHQTRLTFNARYMVTTAGRDHDFWLFGLSLGFLKDPGAAVQDVPHELPTSVDSETVGEVLDARWETTSDSTGQNQKTLFERAIAAVQDETPPKSEDADPGSEELPEGSFWSETWTDPDRTDASRAFLKSQQFTNRPK